MTDQWVISGLAAVAVGAGLWLLFRAGQDAVRRRRESELADPPNATVANRAAATAPAGDRPSTGSTRSGAGARPALPPGAEAALWSVTEVLPDPRNHLAIKDPTSELRLTDEQRAAAAASAALADGAELRPAERARAEQSRAARAAALAKHDELVRRQTPAQLADRMPPARNDVDLPTRAAS